MIQDMTHNIMWKTRNETIHNNEDSELNKQQHEELDQEITNNFSDLPYMCTSDGCLPAMQHSLKGIKKG